MDNLFCFAVSRIGLHAVNVRWVAPLPAARCRELATAMEAHMQDPVSRFRRGSDTANDAESEEDLEEEDSNAESSNDTASPV